MAEDKWIDKLKNISSVDGGGLKNAVPKALLLPVIALFTSLADTIGAAFGVPISIFDASAESVSVLIEGFVESPGNILIAGAEESARSLAKGVWAQFGPFTFLIAVGVVIGAALLVARVREEEETSNFIPGLPGGLDVPLIGTDEE